MGENGAGKTNLLESLHIATQGFSPRTRSDAQLVRFEASAAAISLQVERTGVSHTIRWRLGGDGKIVELDGARIASAETLRREFPALVFTPDRLAVVKGAPAARRAYFDRVVTRLLPASAGVPQQYASALAQRNAALRRVQIGVSPPSILEPWTEAVATMGSALALARVTAIEQLTTRFRECLADFGLPEGSLTYDGDALTVATLSARLDADIARGTTGAGPHLDDVAIWADSRDLRRYGSQGEQRLALLGLLFAEADALVRPPLLLLDDVLSELDVRRRRTLDERISRLGQVLITSADRASFPGVPSQIVEVMHGQAH